MRMAAAKPGPPSVGACVFVCVFVFTGVSGRTCWSVCVCACACACECVFVNQVTLQLAMVKVHV